MSRFLSACTALLLALFFTTAVAQDLPAATDAATDTAAETDISNQDSEMSAEEQAYMAWASEFLDGLNPQRGEIELPIGVATLTVPDEFYYLSPEDSKKVLEDAWGNPPSDLNQGMLFPSGMTPLDMNSWGVTVDYYEEGHIKDDDANAIDYTALLDDMKNDIEDSSPDRVAAGYGEIELIGWAADPYYDQAAKKLHWAKELHFQGEDTNTLNYDIRVLGRKGYLSLSFIAGIEQLPDIQANLDGVLAMADFNAGNQYTDFDPSIDKIAAYGIGGLIAGKVLAKTGFLAAALIFLKKFGVIIVVAIGGLFAKLFKRKKAEA
jgi:uncharacterized membrane-anchored protein